MDSVVKLGSISRYSQHRLQFILTHPPHLRPLRQIPHPDEEVPHRTAQLLRGLAGRRSLSIVPGGFEHLGCLLSQPALFARGPIGLAFQGLAAVASIAVAVRITAEKRLLVERYPEYEAYAARTRRIIPFVF